MYKVIYFTWYVILRMLMLDSCVVILLSVREAKIKMAESKLDGDIMR